MKRTWSALAALLGVLLIVPVLVSQEKQTPVLKRVDAVFDALSAVRRFAQVDITPDGKRVAWVQSERGKKDQPEPGSAIYVVDLDAPNAAPRRVTAGGGTEHEITWSPDGKRLAFLSDAGSPGQFQLHVAPSVGGDVVKLTKVTGYLTRPSWSPDGNQLAVLHNDETQSSASPVLAAAPDVGVIGERTESQRLTVVDRASGKSRAVTPKDLFVYEYAWSPKGDAVVAVAAQGTGANGWYVARLVAIATANGETKLLHRPADQIARPRWSPDGKQIAFIGGLMSDEDVIGGDIYVMPAAGGKPHNLTADRKASPAWLRWQPTGQILFGEHVDGGTALATLDAATGEAKTIWRGAEVVTLGPPEHQPSAAIASDGKTSAVIRYSFTNPPEVWAGPLGQWRPVTHLNSDARPLWGKAETLHWKSDGQTVQGWLIYPRDFEAGRRYPLVVNVHGGPSSMFRSSWPSNMSPFATMSASGYFVLLPNPRGSYGQGEAFTRGNVKDLGHGDLRDIMAGVDEVVKTRPVDEKRLGITGWSYGGFMTMWAVTQTHRFKAAVAGAGVANWQSYYGQNLIDQWMPPFFGATVYDDPAVYTRSSPIQFVKNVKTPTLILVGERDAECPAPQSREFWHALKTLGVKTRLVIYPGEGHGIARPEHRRDIVHRQVQWFEEYLR
jgi:dipeptidyl aminopeptidase/acylaminoacyl peptidase